MLRDGDPTGSPWIDLADLRRRGGLVVWDPSHDGDLSGRLQSRFPMMEMQPPLVLPWHTGAAVPPLRIMWGIIRPLGEGTSTGAPST